MSRSFVWLSGWAIPPAVLKAAAQKRFPEDTHRIIHPSPQAIEEACEHPCHHLIGYSLGSLLLLDSIEHFPATTSITLLAPIFDFKKEADLGGKVTATQLKFLRRWVAKDPAAALNDFYQKAGLSLNITQELPYSLEDLQWGIDALLNLSASPQSAKSHPALIGDTDALLDAHAYTTLNLKLSILPATGHSFEALISQMTL